MNTILIKKKMKYVQFHWANMQICFSGLCLEVNPKWIALSEVLDEIQKEVNESKNFEKCLVVTQDDRTSQQLREVSRSRAWNSDQSWC